MSTEPDVLNDITRRIEKSESRFDTIRPNEKDHQEIEPIINPAPMDNIGKTKKFEEVLNGSNEKEATVEFASA